MSEAADEAIVTTVLAGDIDAFGILVDRYEMKLKRYGRKFLNNREDIEDLVQEVFIKAYTNLHSFDQTQRFSPWLYRIAHNTFVNELRRISRLRLTVFDSDVLLPLLPAKETADAPLLEAELKAALEACLENLSDKYREIVVLYYYEELSYQEISDVLHIPTTTVGVRLSRAKKYLLTHYQTHHA